MNGEEKFISGGLFFYPVLQAADILIYHADYVPVGKDQEQHLELARDTAIRFNTQFKLEYFTPPTCLFSETPKVMALTMPDKKMSKSLGEKHCVGVFEDEHIIRKKIRSAVTDSGYNGEDASPGVENLFQLLKAFGSEEEFKIFQNKMQNGQLAYSELKEYVGDAIILHTKDLREKRFELLLNKKGFIEMLYSSSQNIREKAKKTVEEVKEIVGLYSFNFDGFMD